MPKTDPFAVLEKTHLRGESGADGGLAFTEGPAWRPVGAGWQRVFGGFERAGYSIEWHDFYARRELDWGASFHPRGVELCLNLAGSGLVAERGQPQRFTPGTAGYYRRQDAPLAASRQAEQRHEFLTVEFSNDFLARHLEGNEDGLCPIVLAAMENRSGPAVPAGTQPLTARQQQMVASLREPPVCVAAQPTWYQCKAVELAATFFFRPAQQEELFCTRQKRLAQERVEQVMFVLQQKLAEPLSLVELGRKIGCSPYYLSRTVSRHTGQTISQHLRRLRMEKAAELLRQRELNVTEVALEVGYSSPSHFSHTFHAAFGCCPGLYPLRTVAVVPPRPVVAKVPGR